MDPLSESESGGNERPWHQRSKLLFVLRSLPETAAGEALRLIRCRWTPANAALTIAALRSNAPPGKPQMIPQLVERRCRCLTGHPHTTPPPQTNFMVPSV